MNGIYRWPEFDRVAAELGYSNSLGPVADVMSHPPEWSSVAVGFIATAVFAVIGTVIAWLLSRIARGGHLLLHWLGIPGDDGQSTTEHSNIDLTADERFVVGLLRANDGNVRQVHIVNQSSWSKSKVSRLLSQMEEDGYVEKVAAGRENVIVLTLDTEK